MGIFIFLFVVLFLFCQCHSVWNSKRIMPVFRNVREINFSVLKDSPTFVINTEHKESSRMIFCGSTFRNKHKMGLLTNCPKVLNLFSGLGAQFVSLKSENKELLSIAKKLSLPVLYSVSTTSECVDVVEKSHSSALNFDSTQSSPDQVGQILKQLHQECPYDVIPVYISNICDTKEFESYLNQDDSLNFMVNCDFNKESSKDVRDKLATMQKALDDIRLKLRIARDLKNSCL